MLQLGGIFAEHRWNSGLTVKQKNPLSGYYLLDVCPSVAVERDFVVFEVCSFSSHNLMCTV